MLVCQNTRGYGVIYRKFRRTNEDKYVEKIKKIITLESDGYGMVEWHEEMEPLDNIYDSSTVSHDLKHLHNYCDRSENEMTNKSIIYVSRATPENEEDEVLARE